MVRTILRDITESETEMIGSNRVSTKEICTKWPKFSESQAESLKSFDLLRPGGKELQPFTGSGRGRRKGRASRSHLLTASLCNRPPTIRPGAKGASYRNQAPRGSC